MAEKEWDGRFGNKVRKTVVDDGGKILPDELREEFEDLMIDDLTLRAKYANFSRVIQEEQKALVERSKALWAEAMYTMKLEGKWRYEDGKVYPVDEPVTK